MGVGVRLLRGAGGVAASCPGSAQSPAQSLAQSVVILSEVRRQPNTVEGPAHLGEPA